MSIKWTQPLTRELIHISEARPFSRHQRQGKGAGGRGGVYKLDPLTPPNPHGNKARACPSSCWGMLQDAAAWLTGSAAWLQSGEGTEGGEERGEVIRLIHTLNGVADGRPQECSEKRFSCGGGGGGGGGSLRWSWLGWPPFRPLFLCVLAGF